MITSSRWKCEISDGAACRILSISLGRQTIACHASDKYCFEREDSFEDVQNCTDVFFTAVHLPAVVNSFMLTGDLRSLMCRAVVDVKYLQNLRKVFQLTDHANGGHYFVKPSRGDPLQAQIAHCLVFSQSEGIVLMTVSTTSM